MTVYLIRHGKTAANQDKLYCGQTDLPLSEDGILELSELRGRGVYPAGADIYFTSGFLRAERTLDVIYGRVDRCPLPEIAEYNFGEFEMKSHQELEGRGDYQAWITDQTGLAECPAGESRRQFEARVLAGYRVLLEAARERGRENILAVTHGGVITTLMQHIFPNRRGFYEWQPAPGRGFALVYESGEFCQYKEV